MKITVLASMFSAIEPVAELVAKVGASLASVMLMVNAFENVFPP